MLLLQVDVTESSSAQIQLHQAFEITVILLHPVTTCSESVPVTGHRCHVERTARIT